MQSLVVAAVTVILVLAGCRDGGPDALVLDGSPRYGDDEGVVTAVTRERLTLDGRRTFEVSPQLRAFSTRTLDAVPLLGRQGQYVLVGLDGDTVVWVASVGGVLRVPGQRPVAYYTGDLERVVNGRAEFADGTVLRVAAGVRAPPPGRVRAEIDVDGHVVRRLLVA